MSAALDLDVVPSIAPPARTTHPTTPTGEYDWVFSAVPCNGAWHQIYTGDWASWSKTHRKSKVTSIRACFAKRAAARGERVQVVSRAKHGIFVRRWKP